MRLGRARRRMLRGCGGGSFHGGLPRCRAECAGRIEGG